MFYSLLLPFLNNSFLHLTSICFFPSYILFFFLNVDGSHAAYHSIVKELDQLRELPWAAIASQNSPEGFSVYGIKELCQVNENRVDGLFCSMHFSCTCLTVKIMCTVLHSGESHTVCTKIFPVTK